MKKRPSPTISEQVPEWVAGSRPLRLIAVIVFVAIGLVFFNWMVQPPPQLVRNVKTSYDHVVPPELEPESIPDVDTLIHKIQQATRLALQGTNTAPAAQDHQHQQQDEDEQEKLQQQEEQEEPQGERQAGHSVLGKEERERWRQLNPCRSRSELPGLYSRRKFVRDVEPNAQWQRVLKEYEKLHRACIRKIGSGNLSEYFLTRSNSSGCKFAVGAIPPGAGLGNKVLSMASEFMYAVLTQRVFVVPTATEIPSIMCEPFEGSSWIVDPVGLFTPWHNHVKLWNTSQELYEEIDRVRTGSDMIQSWTYGVQTADPPSYTCHPGNRFFCDTEQAYLSQIPWLYFDGCIYFLPKLFSIPVFRSVLEELFPDRMALTHVLRAVMLPNDVVWSRIQQADHVYLKNADHRFGIQVRYREGRNQFWKHHNMVNKRVLECAVRHGILPSNNTTGRLKPLPGGNPVCVKKEQQLQNDSLDLEASSRTSYEDLAYPKVNVTTIFITSLFQGLYEFMTEVFTRNPPMTGEAIGLIQLTHDNTQTFSLEEDVQALTEIVCLSLSDHLFVTPFSTFGGLAQGYGALTPWFIDIRKESKTDCVRAQTMDTCYQLAANKFTCPYNLELDGSSLFNVVPYIRNCLDVDVPNGLQLITANRTCV